MTDARVRQNWRVLVRHLCRSYKQDLDIREINNVLLRLLIFLNPKDQYAETLESVKSRQPGGVSPGSLSQFWSLENHLGRLKVKPSFPYQQPFVLELSRVQSSSLNHQTSTAWIVYGRKLARPRLLGGQLLTSISRAREEFTTVNWSVDTFWRAGNPFIAWP